MQIHNFDKTILRQYDIRGIFEKTLTAQDAAALGHAFATLVHRADGKKVVVGYDGRLHSPVLADALVNSLVAAGMDVTLIGCGPTPMLYFSVYHLQADGGIMITGSHNPPEYNGFKMMLGKKPFYGEDIQELGRIAATGAYVAKGQGTLQTIDVRTAYTDRLLQGLNFGGKNLKVAWDAGNGAAGEIMARICQQLPGQHILLNEKIDGTFPAHHPDPTVPEYLVQLMDTVKSQQCDLGIAFDGDGDRIGIIDGSGEILWGDQILVLLAESILQEQPGATIIADVKASQVLFDEVARMGGTPMMWQTGHSLIKAKMAETKAPLAGEMCGHIFFADKYYGFDDALYAAVRVLEILSHRAQSLAAFRQALPTVINTPELRFPCSETRKFQVIVDIKPMLEAAGAVVNTVDGVRVTLPQGWWLLRASNTQDVLVARCEAANANGLQVVKDHLSTYLQQLGLDQSVLAA